MNCRSKLGRLLLTLLSLSHFLTTNSYSIDIEPEDKQCFIVTAAVGVSITGSFEVISPNPKPLVVTLTGSDEYIHYTSKYDGKGEDKDYSEGSFSLESKNSGDYVLCLSNGENGNSDGEIKTVAFNFRATDANQQDYEYSGIQSELLALKEGLDFLKDHQSYMNQREDVHKETLESINMKIFCWTILEAVILLGMSIWQITYIRNFFETKRRV
jgi:emp24/gp25L/p24 family/GOLD